MSLTYWDTSALVKVYVSEPDSGFFLELIEQTEQPICTSVITSVEIQCALTRKESAGSIRHAEAIRARNSFAKDCAEGRIIQLPCGTEMVEQARELIGLGRRRRTPVMIRSLDAVHLASALAAGAADIVTTDVRMRDIAALVRLRLVPAGARARILRSGE